MFIKFNWELFKKVKVEELSKDDLISIVNGVLDVTKPEAIIKTAEPYINLKKSTVGASLSWTRWKVREEDLPLTVPTLW